MDQCARQPAQDLTWWSEMLSGFLWLRRGRSTAMKKPPSPSVRAGLGAVITALRSAPKAQKAPRARVKARRALCTPEASRLHVSRPALTSAAHPPSPSCPWPCPPPT